ncbi:MAG TPA: hypothetical protein VNO33_23830 [Kofleriaceae bacterium]|nr:hypothetical protein [Kofleriaceae bacterium]
MPSLARLLRAAAAQGAPLEPRAACAIATRICAELEEPHGGLAPPAIGVDWDGTVTLARQERVSSLAYMAPERLAGRGADHASDLYALGLILSEMMTNRAMQREDQAAARTAALSLEVDLPVELVHIIERATASDPRDRYASPREMAAWLSLAEEESGGAMSREELAEWLSRRFPRDLSAPVHAPPRRRWFLGAAVGLAVCAAGIAVLAARGGTDAAAQPARPVKVSATPISTDATPDVRPDVKPDVKIDMEAMDVSAPVETPEKQPRPKRARRRRDPERMQRSPAADEREGCPMSAAPGR